MKKALLLLVSLLLAPPLLALTLVAAQGEADAWVATKQSAIDTAMASCLAAGEDCATAWSCDTPCNNTANPNSCNNAQADAGRKDQCGVAQGNHRFADRGITLGAQAPVCMAVTSYDGPGGRGYAVLYRMKHTNKIYERAIGYGPQAESFSHAWSEVAQ
jgi:hypothetical protein